ncbi:hypothetical protein CANARDRAFT_7135 [[Candida] arabinofermentans NRRL YB-2248]|uniref:NADPH:adrenodoxin oxidoreductase, mitochondrial n=1 Tax=[Candida] arabinofermentans NRRL YB-2248 TaxID=983967 RepID=A0A1E4T214_9ASCO|nr:hypothetical protein CANARDRAFT_7135 [[Candida] arabinofermentans NRRL YB-2248]
MSSSSPTSALKIAVIGSGPSAFYTSLDLLKTNNPQLEIDMFERNPCPFGLVRFGVAPDHPEVKTCQQRFKDTSEDERFKFFGNVNIGTDLKLQELVENYNIVVYAYGSGSENKLGIPGEDHPAVINSKDFVGWYNGDPAYKNLNVPLHKVKNVTIVGNGNVAIDIVRILLASPDSHWSKTDITSEALETLKKSTVENVCVSARRGFLDSKFTNKEFKELLEMEKEGIMFKGWSADHFQTFASKIKLGRIEKRRLQLAQKYSDGGQKVSGKSWELEYLQTPVEFIGDTSDPILLKETVFQQNSAIMNNDNKIEIVPTETLTCKKNELVILSIGYKGEPLQEFENLGIPFDSKRGKIPNIDGKIMREDGSFVTGAYCVGWIANGSTGNINSSVQSSAVVAATIMDDVEADGSLLDYKEGRNKIEQLLSERNIKNISWDDWLKIEQAEIKRGEAQGKIADKITDYEEMLDIAKRS